MLVFAKNPMGYLSLGPHRIYGRYFSYGRFGPTNISWKLYLENRDILEEAEYTSDILKKNFGIESEGFFLSRLTEKSYTDLVRIAKAVGIKYHRVRKKISINEKRALLRSIRKKFDEPFK